MKRLGSDDQFIRALKVRDEGLRASLTRHRIWALVPDVSRLTILFVPLRGTRRASMLTNPQTFHAWLPFFRAASRPK